mmetsp:Transcript_36229/g.122678  ORF Transcript_36229/g.122678 Transcript_36229/m.122678 type:complete len:172 (+) Transcript_36229:62-577(+)
MALTKLSLLVAAATALAPTPTLRTVSRRSFGGLVVAAPGVASAAGTKLENGQALPDGALQFDRFRKVQAEWNRFGSRLEKENIDDKEWDGVPQFLRKLYDAGDDMLFMSKAMDASKKEQAKVLATDFKAQVKAVDRPAQAKDRDAVVKTYKSTSGIMQSFLDLASDVPDEL